ncbi:preprotein translocase subunit SecG [Candidatus Liberibacter asiaticus]|uniref:Protein-export membrane protein SecG n=2 Tax=Liberibacter asiaticus TaxID=34021 RepID=C6XHC6_LIBAP|nr:preprotein translocase subunit SecG [Candidatus Liberibacter asiaticus]ACT56669.1 hypothetical protein CLIBASIA_00405 [Candidatus Liberibacter asiaticus str. psy62]AGH16438.1 hypothetical protein WSI_00315 [Candidatus Liberibacter asiaticus str. gxpsy]ALK06848.1 preprotein translocase subunit SecG [Candidatus Liberibacter asiaticus]ASK52316.1 preprotein translocase subunit SecG [Candidatus Liberibacter asiaticus]AWL13638.1 preprotein translocase subunit SecG [Candidatus Liberibacter asiatic
MQIFLMVVHLIVVVGLVCVILIQSSDSSAFGSSSNFTSVRSTAHSLGRFTAILAFFFFATSIALGMISRYTSTRYKDNMHRSLVDSIKDQGNDNFGDGSSPKLDSVSAKSSSSVVAGKRSSSRTK